ncbi:diguanylate cyclase [Desulfobacula toluolica]|uniref:Two component system response regulator, modulated diguanylate cyclase n=1 Tax=Desulfobacula toluolica (strain DSM 7467 / Tol2) TaxID=651182 RepID=K0NSJ0_DESTT|nr:HD domain-containing phosphohydrolase [Desulfobacula toluolica]CCK81957.1 two component system response regulator, modulated diguanylate cyclase [Desulfobacula toluolica Tol2]
MKEQLIKNYEQETHAPFVDSLTGLFNHGIFQILLQEEIKRSRRYGDTFTLALINIDSFSLYNKRNNPAIGDHLLQKVTKFIKKNLRNPDVAARYSGDEFAIILPKSNLSGAHIALDRIRVSVEKHTHGTLTLSAGLASFPREASNRETLILKAQEALLQAKIMGKNKVCFLKKERIHGPEQKFKILIVDDDSRNVKLMGAVLTPFNHEIFKVYNGEEALSLMKRIDMDLVLLDIMMPHMDGYEVCRRLKKSEDTRLVPIIMLTALDDTQSRIKGIEAGADDFITKPPNRVELTARINSLLRVNQLNKKLISIENILISMANAVEAKDAYTQGHTQRVADMSVALGKKMGLSAMEIDALRLSGILHDIGKIGVPREILNKPGRLNSDEWKSIKRHPAEGYRICLPLKKTLGPALEAIRHHHEKIDGSGYPDGIKGDDISILARIIAIVDIFDALNTDRPYRKGMSREKTFKILREEANKGKLDKKIVEHLIEMIDMMTHKIKR